MTTSGKILEGVFAINKPQGKSSAQVLRDLQEHFNPSRLFAPWLAQEREKRNSEPSYERRKRSKAKRTVQVKLGHGGTLDPLATGVLIVGVGKGTKELNSFLGCTKTYETVVLFGAATDSYDILGNVVGRKPYGHITKSLVCDALEKFRGKGMQTPPIFSALHQDGKRLYEYAREGLELPRAIEQREVNVSDLQLVEWLPPGTHDYAIPAGEAEPAVKQLATKMMDGAAVEPFIGDDNKRKRAQDTDADTIADEAKRARYADLESPAEARQGENVSSVPTENPQTDPSFTQQDALTSPSLGPPACRIKMTVSSGFYVRSLCHDLGKQVGSMGLMAALVRSQQAEFELGKNVFEYSDLQEGEESWAPTIESLLKSRSKDLSSSPQQTSSDARGP